MTATKLPVLHATRPAWRAVLDGSPILPVDERLCPQCGGETWPRTGLAVACRRCKGKAVVPPVLSGRFNVAVDGVIVGTATAREMLPVVGFPCGLTHLDDHLCVERRGKPLLCHGGELATIDPALDLRPGGWVVQLSDPAPTTERCPFGHDEPRRFRAEDIDSDAPLDGSRLAADIAATVPEANRDLRRAEWRAEMKARARARRDCAVCMFGEPVPVESAPAGTVTTWEAG